MSVIDLHSFAAGRWVGPDPDARPIASAVTGETVARAGGRLDFQAMIDHAVDVGGPALRAMTFHDRARMLKALALHLMERKEALYRLSHMAGSTRADCAIDVDGGFQTMLVYAAKGRREMPDGHTYLDGEMEMLSRSGTFVGQHVCVPKRGVAVHVNAFNFPVWGMLEKLAPTWLAGMPAIVKPATATAYVAEACFRMMMESDLVPDGAVQLVVGGLSSPGGDLLDRLGPQDVVSFTGSADTALKLRSNPNLLARSVPFIAEQDSLNASVLGPDATRDTPEFDLFVREVVREMTAKAGQKCTAIRRIMVPEGRMDEVAEAVSARLSATVIGDPADEATRMGALVSRAQRDDVLAVAEALRGEARLVHEQPLDAGLERGAFVSPMLFACDDPDAARAVHEREAFGPVSTLMPYRDAGHACRLLNRGQGSLVASIITHDAGFAREVAQGAAAWHGRIYVNDRVSMKESTGHGSPLPHMVHGGPGRAGGGEELGGIRGVMHYMARTALQGSPDMVSAIAGTWLPGARTREPEAHPFTRTFDELELGDTLRTASREVTLEDIEHFAAFTGDNFYAHMDEEAAAANPFFPGRVAHGYLILSFAAGLFVQPDPGPVLANTGLTDLAFQKPVVPGDGLRVSLTVRRKTRRTDEYGEVRWHVVVTNQDDEPVATYTLITMNAYG